MRILFYIILFVLYLPEGFSQTWEVINTDTCNKTLANGSREGKFILCGRHKPKTCYTHGQIAETGYYENNMKQGLWKEYHCSNMIKSEQVYVNGKVNGSVTLYYENGKKRAQGSFKIDHWVNELQLFDENGNRIYLIKFNAEGKRQQSFYYKNLPIGNRDSVMVSIAN